MPNAKEKNPDAPGRLGPFWRLYSVCLVLAIVAGACYALWEMRRGMLATAPYCTVVSHVRLADVPVWLPDDIAQGVLAAAKSAAAGRNIFDEDLAPKVYHAVAASPWVGKVNRVVKKSDGTVVVEARYRRPFALVCCSLVEKEETRVVDEEGVVLPLAMGRIKPGSFVTILDADNRPPKAGQKWDSPGVRDGLRLLKLVQAKPYVNEITRIDVRNYGGRLNVFKPHLSMYAGAGEREFEVRFGRFPADDGLDYVSVVDERLEILDKYYRLSGSRLAGTRSYIDLQLDQPYVSSN